MICCCCSVTAVQSADSSGVLECPFMDAASSTTTKSRTIPANRINDDYCDCPLTGADEPNTSACAGSSDWPGVRVVVAVVTPGDEKQNEEATYVCVCVQHTSEAYTGLIFFACG
jgi:hypothetical protein